MNCLICGNKINKLLSKNQTCGKNCGHKLTGLKNRTSLKSKKQSKECTEKKSKSEMAWWKKASIEEKTKRLQGLRNLSKDCKKKKDEKIGISVKKIWDSYSAEEKDNRVKNCASYWQTPESKIKAAKTNGSKNYGTNTLETLMRNTFVNMGVKEFEIQFPIKRSVLDKLGRSRYYFLDFGFPKYKIGVECDGEPYHKDKDREFQRQKEIEEQGWKIIRFIGVEIVKDPIGCANKVKSSLPNFQ